MSNVLDSKDFGSKIYGRFPPKYREDDAFQNYALKRYLQSLSDGGFKYSIDEINGILDLVDPEKVDAKVLPILFQQYGLKVFNGIPEEYLRYLLPKLGEAWSKKGSLNVIEFITASLSGIKTTTEVTYDEFGNPKVDVKLDMDYNIGDYFPDSQQFNRLLANFIPFYCDHVLVYSYMFYENQVLVGKDELLDNVQENKEEASGIRLYKGDSSILNNATLGNMILGGETYNYEFEDHIKTETLEKGSILKPTNSFTNNPLHTLNNNFYTNGLYSYDIITILNTEKTGVFGKAVMGNSLFDQGDSFTEIVFN